MGYSIAYNSGTTTPFGTFKQGPITMGLKPDEYTVSSGFTWYANAEYTNDAYLIISDTYSQGWSTQAESKPTIWRSETGTSESFVSLVNQLPDVNGVTGFTDSGEAMGYLQSTGKYFVSKDDYLGIVSDGLILNLDAGWYPSYSGSGTTWKDIKGSNNGTLINGTSFDSSNGGCLSFDGSDDYVNIGVGKSCNGFSSDFCISAWVNRSNTGGWGNIIGDWATQFTSLEWQLAMNTSGGLFFYNGANGFVFGIPVSSGFGSNTWINVVISRIGSSFKLYVNTNLLSTRTNTSTFGSPTGNLNIGVDGDNSSERFGGKISNVLIYKNKGLTDTEILQNYNATKGRFGL